MTTEAFYVAMTRGRFSNVAYVATDGAHLEEHQHTPGYEDEVTGRTILYDVLQHEGTEKSAHETIEAEQEKWSSIAQLAAEYETIAQAAQHQRFATAVAASGAEVLRVDYAARLAALSPSQCEAVRADVSGFLAERPDLAVALAPKEPPVQTERAGGETAALVPPA
ncbi:MAG TPA: hypothetical protein VFW38_12090 [Solirubrobacteraceae bacterium]|nr:hypothetical protein [Solirubrobacteraceae bacterium]